MKVVWISDPGWSGVYSYALVINGETIGRVFQCAQTNLYGKSPEKGDWKGFLNGSPLGTFSGDGSLENAKEVLLNEYYKSLIWMNHNRNYRS